MHSYESLLDPYQDGVVRVPHFMTATDIGALNAELADTSRVTWHDNHEILPPNERGMQVIQNHHSFTLKLSRGNQQAYNRLPNVRHAVKSITDRIHSIGRAVTSLRTWEPDEVSVQRYDMAETGLGFHKDSKRYVGLIAILSVSGIADLAVKHGDNVRTYTPEPGDLILLRGSELINNSEDIRPEHAVLNLQTATRTSLMVRANARPDDHIPGFHFANWPVLGNQEFLE